MSRNSIGIKTDVFAADGQREILPTFATQGYGSEYTSGVFPDRRHMNDVLARVTATCADVNKFGAALPWDSGITYSVGAIVTVGLLQFVCIQEALNKSPETETLYWTPVVSQVVNTRQDQVPSSNAVKNYVASNKPSLLSAGTYALTSIHQNTSVFRMLVTGYVAISNDPIIQVYIGETSNPSTLVVYIRQRPEDFSESSNQITFVVPAGWYFKVVASSFGSGTVTSHRLEGWEI